VIDDEMGDEVKVTVIAAGFDRIDAGSTLMSDRPSARITELFAEPEEEDEQDDDDDFDVPSFLK
jgi:cell division protein FtsZ